jgi:hypothetical protein
MLVSGHGTKVDLAATTIADWEQALIVEAGAAIDMHDTCRINGTLCGVFARDESSYACLSSVSFLDVGAKGDKSFWSAAVRALNRAHMHLMACEISGCDRGVAGCGSGVYIHVEKTVIRGCGMCGVFVDGNASVHLIGSKVIASKDANVLVERGATVRLDGCEVIDSVSNSGVRALGKRTKVEAEGSLFQGNCEHGLCMDDWAIVKLVQCTLHDNKLGGRALLKENGNAVAPILERAFAGQKKQTQSVWSRARQLAKQQAQGKGGC